LHTEQYSQDWQVRRVAYTKASAGLALPLCTPGEWRTPLSYYDNITAKPFCGRKVWHLLGIVDHSIIECRRSNSYPPRRAYGISPAEVVRRLLFSLKQSLTITTEEL